MAAKLGQGGLLGAQHIVQVVGVVADRHQQAGACRDVEHSVRSRDCDLLACLISAGMGGRPARSHSLAGMSLRGGRNIRLKRFSCEPAGRTMKPKWFCCEPKCAVRDAAQLTGAPVLDHQDAGVYRGNLNDSMGSTGHCGLLIRTLEPAGHQLQICEQSSAFQGSNGGSGCQRFSIRQEPAGLVHKVT